MLALERNLGAADENVQAEQVDRWQDGAINVSKAAGAVSKLKLSDVDAGGRRCRPAGDAKHQSARGVGRQDFSNLLRRRGA